MSAVSAIYNAPIVARAILPDSGEVAIIIKYQGRFYNGEALLHPQDKDFFSEKVGSAIALSRARIEALKDVLQETQLEALYKQKMWFEVTKFGNSATTDFDPTGYFLQNVTKTTRRVKQLEEALKKEQAALANYITNHGKALQSIQKHRDERKDEVD